MKTASVVNSSLFSIFLLLPAAVSESILLGGIDTMKYSGPLTTLSILPTVSNGQVETSLRYFATAITSAKTTVGGKVSLFWSGSPDGVAAYNATNPSLPVLLDTGSTSWRVRADLFDNKIKPAFPYVNFTSGQRSCKHASSRDTISLIFGGASPLPTTPAVSLSQQSWHHCKLIPFDCGHDACAFLISHSESDGYSLLGRDFLENMYIDFDLDTGQASVAQAVPDSKEPPNIVPIGAGEDGLAKEAPSVITASPNAYRPLMAPSATIKHAVSTLAMPIGTVTGMAAVPVAVEAHLSSMATSPAASTGSAGHAQASPAPDGPHSYTGATAGGVVGGVIGLALLGALMYIYPRKQKSKSNRPVYGSESLEVQQPPKGMQSYGNRGSMPPRHSDMESAAPKPPHRMFHETFTNDGRHELSGLRREVSSSLFAGPQDGNLRGRLENSRSQGSEGNVDEEHIGRSACRSEGYL